MKQYFLLPLLASFFMVFSHKISACELPTAHLHIQEVDGPTVTFYSSVTDGSGKLQCVAANGELTGLIDYITCETNQETIDVSQLPIAEFEQDGNEYYNLYRFILVSTNDCGTDTLSSNLRLPADKAGNLLKTGLQPLLTLGKSWKGVFIMGNSPEDTEQTWSKYQVNLFDTLIGSSYYTRVRNSENGTDRYLRESRGKVYSLYDEQEILLYDFTASKGDIVEVGPDKEQLRVDSIGSTKTPLGETLKTWHLTQTEYGVHLIWIESVGDTRGLFQSWNNIPVDCHCWYELACCSNYETLLYSNEKFPNCGYQIKPLLSDGKTWRIEGTNRNSKNLHQHTAYKTEKPGVFKIKNWTGSDICTLSEHHGFVYRYSNEEMTDSVPLYNFNVSVGDEYYIWTDTFIVYNVQEDIIDGMFQKSIAVYPKDGDKNDLQEFSNLWGSTNYGSLIRYPFVFVDLISTSLLLCKEKDQVLYGRCISDDCGLTFTSAKTVLDTICDTPVQFNFLDNLMFSEIGQLEISKKPNLFSATLIDNEFLKLEMTGSKEVTDTIIITNYIEPVDNLYGTMRLDTVSLIINYNPCEQTEYSSRTYKINVGCPTLDYYSCTLDTIIHKGGEWEIIENPFANTMPRIDGNKFSISSIDLNPLPADSIVLVHKDSVGYVFPVTNIDTITFILSDEAPKLGQLANGLPQGTVTDITKMWNNLLLAKADGAMYQSADGGLNWEASNQSDKYFGAIHDEYGGWYNYSEDDGLFIKHPDSLQWRTESFSDFHISSVDYFADTLFVALWSDNQFGKVVYSADQGVTWQTYIDQVVALGFYKIDRKKSVMGTPEGPIMYNGTAPSGQNITFPNESGYLYAFSIDEFFRISETEFIARSESTFIHSQDGGVTASVNSADDIYFTGNVLYRARQTAYTDNQIQYFNDGWENLQICRDKYSDAPGNIIRFQNSMVYLDGGSVYIKNSVPYNGTMSADAIAKKVVPADSNNGSISLSVEGGIYPYRYAWSTGETSESISNITAGEYTVTITDASGDSIVYATSAKTGVRAILVMGYVYPANDDNPIQLTIYHDTDTLNDEADKDGYYIIPVPSTSNSIDVLFSKEGYRDTTIHIQIGSSAPNVADIWLKPRNTNLPVTEIITKVTLPGAADGVISLSCQGGRPPYSYQWNNGQTGNTANGLPAGTYFVTITDSQGSTGIKQYTVDVANHGDFSVSGTVYSADGSVYRKSAIVLYSDIAGSYMPYILKETSFEGEYTFSNLPEANYLLQAIPPMDSTHLPTFAYSSIQSETAEHLLLNGSTTHFDIALQKYTYSALGTGSIRGNITSSETDIARNSYFFGEWARLKSEGTYLQNIPVYLYNDAGVIVAWDITDGNGNYAITNLQAGSYRAVIDMPGIGYAEFPVAVSETETEQIVDFSLSHKNGITLLPTKDITEEIAVFPNPVLETLHFGTSVSATLTTTSGAIVEQCSNCSSLDVKNVASGMYLLQVQSANKLTVRSILKQ